MSSTLLHTMGVLISEPKVLERGGKKYIEPFVKINTYVKGVGKTELKVKIPLWEEKADHFLEKVKAHKQKLTEKGINEWKALPLYLIGYMYTNTYKKDGKDVSETCLSLLEVLKSEVPIFHGTGVISTEVQLQSRKTKTGNVAMVELPVYFNGFYPGGIGESSFDGYITFWREDAENIYEKAQKHTNKNNEPTGGKGMVLEFVAYQYTNKYEKDGQKRSNVKLSGLDASFPSSIFGGNGKTSNTSSTNATTKKEEKPATNVEKNEKPIETPATKTEEAPNFNMDFGTPGDSNDLLGDFDKFLKQINEEHVGN